MALLLTAMIGSISIVNAGILLIWACITIEIGGYKGERIAWKDITSITDGKHLPTVYSNKYRVSKGYETLFIEGV